MIVVSSCTGESASTHAPVAVRGVDVSDDRRTLTVRSTYPIHQFCAKAPGGVHVEVTGDVAVVAAYVVRQANFRDGDSCTLECGIVTQEVTLDAPIADDIQFQSPTNADPGCG